MLLSLHPHFPPAGEIPPCSFKTLCCSPRFCCLVFFSLRENLYYTKCYVTYSHVSELSFKPSVQRNQSGVSAQFLTESKITFSIKLICVGPAPHSG